MDGVEDHAVRKHAPVTKWHRLQAVHELEDILALHLDGDAELITLSGKRLLELGEAERRGGHVGDEGHGEDVLDDALRDVADIDARLG